MITSVCLDSATPWRNDGLT